MAIANAIGLIPRHDARAGGHDEVNRVVLCNK
jgi:hypothetical protein